MRAVIVALAVLSCSCASTTPQATTSPARTEPGTGTSVRIVSIVGHPNGSGGRWELPADQDTIELRVTLQGRGTFEVRAVLEPLDGDALRELERTIELDGEEQLGFDELLVPVPGSYRLTVEVAGEGVRSSQTISVRRG